MESKKTILIMSVAVSIAAVLIAGSTYAWYAYNNAETKVIGSTIKETPTTIFAKTDQILNKDIMPIYDEDRYNYASKNSFTVTFGENLRNYNSAIEINLDNIKMSEELKIANYKYELLENNIVIASGNFSEIGNNSKLTLMPMKIITGETYPITNNYDLYIWLSEDNSVQNELMNKVFSAKVNVNSAIKK